MAGPLEHSGEGDLMKRRVTFSVVAGGALLLATQSTTAEAAGGEAAHGLDPVVLLGVAVILIAAKLGGELFERMKQPAVLGELVIGIVIGNLALTGWTAAEPLRTNAIIAALAEVGVIIQRVEVGLESNLG